MRAEYLWAEPGGATVFSDFLYSPVRSLAYLEAVAGSLFMAVFIARLIGGLASNHEGREE